MKNIILILTILMLLVSCGARKSNVDITKEDSKSVVFDNSIIEKKTDANVKQTSTIKVDDKNQTIVEETTYQAEDPTKEAVVMDDNGKKIVLNNSKKTIKKTIQNNNIKTDSNINSEIKQNKAYNEQKDVKGTIESKTYKKQKETEKKAIPWYYWVLGLGIILFIIWLFKKYKEKIWWV